MKVLLYFENQEKIKTSGIGRALRHQIEALTSNGVEYTLDPKDTYDIAHINTYFPKAKSLLKKAMVNAVKTKNEDLISEINLLLSSVNQ